MAKLAKIPEFFTAMTETELQDFLSTWELEDEFDKEGKLIRVGMINRAIEWGVIDDLEALLDETSPKKRYPRVLKPSKKDPEKLTWQADKTQKPEMVVSPVGFFEVKAKFIHDVLGFPRLKEEPVVDFRAKIRAAAAAARANKKDAAYEAAAAKVDAKLAEMKKG